MPPLPNPRQERFCQELVKGKTQLEAYKEAGYAPDDGHAARLAGIGRIRSRVEELFDETIPDVKYDREAVNQIYTYLLNKAKKAEKLETAKAITDSIAKVNGLMINRTEYGKVGEFEALSDNELLELIATPLGEIRSESADE